MTDTTDMAALRELLSHENLESDYHVGVTVTTLRLLLSKADHLEAERQRADYGRQVLDQRNAECDRLINEIAAVRKQGEIWERDARHANAELAALKAKLTNPVVLPKYSGDLNHETAFLRGVEATARKISEAGFTVKGKTE